MDATWDARTSATPTQYKEKYRAKQNQDFGRIYVGAVFPNRAESERFQAVENVGGTTGHILALSTIKPDAFFTYYFGSGWSRNPSTQFQSLADWERYLSEFSQRVAAPLKVTLK